MKRIGHMFYARQRARKTVNGFRWLTARSAMYNPNEIIVTETLYRQTPITGRVLGKAFENTLTEWEDETNEPKVRHVELHRIAEATY